jgi:hypothetical protein
MYVNLRATRDWIDRQGRIFRVGREYTVPRGAARVMVQRGRVEEVSDAQLQPEAHKRTKRRSGQPE